MNQLLWGVSFTKELSFSKNIRPGCESAFTWDVSSFWPRTSIEVLHFRSWKAKQNIPAGGFIFSFEGWRVVLFGEDWWLTALISWAAKRFTPGKWAQHALIQATLLKKTIIRCVLVCIQETSQWILGNKQRMLLLMQLFCQIDIADTLVHTEMLYQGTELIVSPRTRVRRDVQGCPVLMGYRVLQALCSCYP